MIFLVHPSYLAVDQQDLYYWVVELCKIFVAPQVILTLRMPGDTLNSVTGHTDLILSGESSLSKI